MPKGKSKRRKFSYDSQVKRLAIKCYDEQLFEGSTPKCIDHRWVARDEFHGFWWGAKKAKDDKECNSKIGITISMAKVGYSKVERFMNKLLKKRIEELGEDWCCIAIYHNKDVARSESDIYEVATEKGHWHILIWRANGKRFRLSKALALLGVHFELKRSDGKPGRDLYMFDNGGVETIKNLPSYAMYLTHETQQAELDGKYEYKFEKLVSNLSDTKVKSIRAGYIKDNVEEKLSKRDWDQRCQMAYKLGQNLKNFKTWRNASFTAYQRSSSVFHQVEQAYKDGLEDGLSNYSTLHPDFTRCSIWILGSFNAGKTWASLGSLTRLGINTYHASSNSGKYDGLDATYTGLVFDDVGTSDALQVFDNKPVKLYRRNSYFAPWVGTYAVVTSNLDYLSLAKDMLGITHDVDSFTDNELERLKALLSRVYVCRLRPENRHLQLLEKQSRGDKDSIKRHDELFNAFKKEFDSIMDSYVPDENNISTPLIDKLKTPLMHFIDDAVPQCSWDLLPFDFLFDLYIAYMRHNFPSNHKLLSKHAFITKIQSIFTTEVIGDFKYIKGAIQTGSKMDKPEYFIRKYNLRFWMNLQVSGSDPDRRYIPQTKSSYEGLVRISDSEKNALTFYGNTEGTRLISEKTLKKVQ